MRPNVGIVAAGVVALAIAAVTVAAGTPAPETSRRTSLAEAQEAVQQFLARAGALYESGGDPRVAERLPAAPDLLSEMLADIAFAQHRLELRESRRLVRADRVGAAWLPGGGAEVRTREFWIVRQGPLRGEGPELPPISTVFDVRYELARDAGTWVVVDYRLEADAPGAGAGGR